MDTILNYDHPYVCTDAVIFSIHTREPNNYRKLPKLEISILLYKRSELPFEGIWCLPGGFLNIDEMPEENIKRKIFNKVNISDCYLEQLYTFSNVDRDPRARVISISYLGLVNEQQSNQMNSNWFDIVSIDNDLQFISGDTIISSSQLGFDHINIIKYALDRLKSKIAYTDIIFHLLPKKFTLTELQNAYEAITGEPEQTANFRRKINNMVKETDELVLNKGHRPAKFFVKGDIQ